MSDFNSLSPDELERVAGGKRQSTTGLFGWFDNIYKSIVNHFGAQIGGNKLAEGMYGKHTTDRDRHRAQLAMHKYLEDGHKLPKGVPNLFG
jgi:hypothetical protein